MDCFDFNEIIFKKIKPTFLNNKEKIKTKPILTSIDFIWKLSLKMKGNAIVKLSKNKKRQFLSEYFIFKIY